jgi:hypothetical protein
MEARRARLALLAAVVGIGAALLAYAISPAVRREVGHAEHSVKHTVSNIFDHDRAAHKAHRHARTRARPARPSPAHPRPVRRAVSPAQTRVSASAHP